jgi:hypothetical protein
VFALRALVFVNRHRTVSLGLISSAEIDSRAQTRDLAELELLKAGDYTLYGFSLAPIFAFSLRSLCVLFAFSLRSVVWLLSSAVSLMAPYPPQS